MKDVNKSYSTVQLDLLKARKTFAYYVLIQALVLWQWMRTCKHEAGSASTHSTPRVDAQAGADVNARLQCLPQRA